MKKYSILLLLCIQFMACSKDLYLKRNIKSVSYELLKMKKSDQLIRYHDDYIDHYYGIINLQYKLDSLTWINDTKALDSLISITTFTKNNYRNFNEQKKRDYLDQKEFTNLTMIHIDSVNTAGLIRLTKKYGFPSHDRLVAILGEDYDTKYTSSPAQIFVHTPELYIPIVRKLVIKEYLSGRMDKNSCSRIFWHLNGRKGDPFSPNYEHCKVDTLR